MVLSSRNISPSNIVFREANQQALTQLASVQQQLDKLIQQLTAAKLTVAGLACGADKVNVSVSVSYDNQEDFVEYTTYSMAADDLYGSLGVSPTTNYL
jgi:hypothetical protein